MIGCRTPPPCGVAATPSAAAAIQLSNATGCQQGAPQATTASKQSTEDMPKVEKHAAGIALGTVVEAAFDLEGIRSFYRGFTPGYGARSSTEIFTRGCY
jgi:hypothetical protein